MTKTKDAVRGRLGNLGGPPNPKIASLTKGADRRVLEVALDQIQPNPHQPRKRFDPTELEELATSIRSRGIIQPVLLRRADEGFELIAGERRLRASEIAGRTTIPAILSTGDPAEDALLENLHRTDLNPIELADHLQLLQETKGVSQTDLSEHYGLHKTKVSRLIALLDLPDRIRSEAPEFDWRLRNLYELTQLELEETELLVLWDATKAKRPSVKELADLRKPKRRTSSGPPTAVRASRQLRRALQSFQGVEDLGDLEPDARQQLIEALHQLLNRLEG